MEYQREDRYEDILDNGEDVELKKIHKDGKLFYIDGKDNVYDKKSFLQKFEKFLVTKLKVKMSSELKQTTQAFIGSIVDIMFTEFGDKKVGKDFSVDDCVSKIMEKFDINVEATGENTKKKATEKVEKVKKPRKKSGYNIFISDNKAMLNEKIAKILEETGEKKTPPSVAGPLWKALSDEEKKVYNDKAAALE